MINVIYEDNHLLVVEKPVNIPVQGDSSNDEDLLTMLKQYLKEKYAKPGEVYLGLVHRLDRPVGGIMVFARTSKAASRLSKIIAERTFAKTYLAIVEGHSIRKSDTLTDYLIKDSKTNTVSVSDEAHGKKAVLDYELLNSRNDLNLVKVNLHTGRSHQIRVQFASRNMPLWGDQGYNPKA
ncbi:MAG: RNA pseudouridine synthase, partial [Erysipelotrichaceae bacterium]|nr:RNA pseudouridine synthase [Erysipelotrichaceae bacterium]